MIRESYTLWSALLLWKQLEIKASLWSCITFIHFSCKAIFAKEKWGQKEVQISVQKSQVCLGFSFFFLFWYSYKWICKEKNPSIPNKLCVCILCVSNMSVFIINSIWKMIYLFLFQLMEYVLQCQYNLLLQITLFFI